MRSYRFRLYVMGETARSRMAIEQLSALCKARLGSGWDVEVVDVQGRSDLADAARIVATPTLDRVEPAPRVRVIGDLSSEELAMVLGIVSTPTPDGEG